MAIILTSNSGLVLDMDLLMQNFLEDFRLRDAQEGNKSTIESLQFKQDLFNLRAPFMMDSEFLALKRDALKQDSPISEPTGSYFRRALLSKPDTSSPVVELENSAVPPDLETTVDGSPRSGRRLKRKKRSQREADLSEEDRHYQSMTVEMVSSLPNFFAQPVSECMDNNTSFRYVANEIMFMKSPELVAGQCYSNSLPYATIAEYGLEKYIIPADCLYYSSMFSGIDCLLKDGKRYDFFVVDPPWENKSVKRLQQYYHLPEEELLTLPFQELSREGALIALWITNNERIKDFVERRLLPAWGAVKEAEWTWVKVTRSGVPVYSFSSKHKKPYEKLVFARIGKRSEGVDAVPDGKVIVSVPSAIHSHKPSLYEVAKLYLPGEAECLELFARSLTPGWTSWGLEVLRLQNARLYEVCNKSTLS